MRVLTRSSGWKMMVEQVPLRVPAKNDFTTGDYHRYKKQQMLFTALKARKQEAVQRHCGCDAPFWSKFGEYEPLWRMEKPRWPTCRRHTTRALISVKVVRPCDKFFGASLTMMTMTKTMAGVWVTRSLCFQPRRLKMGEKDPFRTHDVWASTWAKQRTKLTRPLVVEPHPPPEHQSAFSKGSAAL